MELTNFYSNKTTPYLGGTPKTSGWSSATPDGSLSTSSRLSTQVWMGLRWAGTTASHCLSRGREQSAEGGGRSGGGTQQSPVSVWHLKMNNTVFEGRRRSCLKYVTAASDSLNRSGSTRLEGSSRFGGRLFTLENEEENWGERAELMTLKITAGDGTTKQECNWTSSKLPKYISALKPRTLK